MLTAKNPSTCGLSLGISGRWALAAILFAGCFLGTSLAFGQVGVPTRGGQKYYQPLNQNLPAGVNGYWSGVLGKATPPYFQPIRVDLPTEGQVTVYHGPTATPYSLKAGKPFAYLVGHVYRFRIYGMPEYPGIELYPSVELLDRLHPPPGKELDYPIPLQFTEREIEAALDGRLVTKVVFLEQPNLAPIRDPDFPTPTPEFESTVNILAEADRAGRPMAIIRLGSRVPGAGIPERGFFGTGAPVYLPQTPKPTPKLKPATNPTPATPMK